jgi:hypothetical protein
MQAPGHAPSVNHGCLRGGPSRLAIRCSIHRSSRDRGADTPAPPPTIATNGVLPSGPTRSPPTPGADTSALEPESAIAEPPSPSAMAAAPAAMDVASLRLLKSLFLKVMLVHPLHVSLRLLPLCDETIRPPCAENWFASFQAKVVAGEKSSGTRASPRDLIACAASFDLPCRYVRKGVHDAPGSFAQPRGNRRTGWEYGTYSRWLSRLSSAFGPEDGTGRVEPSGPRRVQEPLVNDIRRGKSLPFGQVYATLGRLARAGKVVGSENEPCAAPDRVTRSPTKGWRRLRCVELCRRPRGPSVRAARSA